jgi:hypothetical protein
MAQPNMGPRKLVAVRPPADIATAFELELAQMRMTCSELLADIAAERYGLPLPSMRVRTKRARLTTAQEPLPGQLEPTPRPRDPRENYGTRLPVDVFDCLAAEAKPAELPYGILLCDILAERYGLVPVSKRAIRPQRAGQGQSVLPLSGVEEVSRLGRAS